LIDDVVQAFLKTEVAVKFRKQAQIFKADEVLQADLQLLEENRDLLAFRPEIRALQKSILMNKKIYEFKLAENDVQEVLSDLAKAIAARISETISVDENLPLKKGGHHGRHTCSS
jgi:cell fate (sporulation/competence/biofilm development) regulator YlbF (YheA/YmcA/DUF963 family)